MSNSACALAVSLGYGGPKRHESGPLLVSTNQLPVRSNGAFGRGFARFSGASALSGSCGTGACATSCVGATAKIATRTAAVNLRVMSPFDRIRRT
jgi:hypothetical protein